MYSLDTQNLKKIVCTASQHENFLEGYKQCQSIVKKIYGLDIPLSVTVDPTLYNKFIKKLNKYIKKNNLKELKYITLSDLKAMGWTKRLATKFYPIPETNNTYAEVKAKRIMATPEFQEALRVSARSKYYRTKHKIS